MKPSLKAALLSGLVFPGAGYLAVKRPVRALIAMTLALLSLAYLLELAVSRAMLILDKAMSGDVPLDANGIYGLAASASDTSGSGLASIATFVLIACWVISTLDGYRIGRKLEDVADKTPAQGAVITRAQTTSVARTQAPVWQPEASADVIAPEQSPAQISVRKVQRDELPQLLQLYRHLHADDRPLPDAAVVEATWQAMLGNPSMRVLVAVAEGALIASVSLLIVPNLTRGASPYALIENVVTDRAWRKRGVGTRLLRAAQQIAWDAGCYKVMLMTGSKKEETLRFYRRAGFVDGDKTAFVARPASLAPSADSSGTASPAAG